jgi:hypothetical protein
MALEPAPIQDLPYLHSRLHASELALHFFFLSDPT